LRCGRSAIGDAYVIILRVVLPSALALERL
jgi:hypothetical protein